MTLIDIRAFEALNRAALAIAGNLSLDQTLRQIVESAKQLAQAKYAAIGVPDGKGGLTSFIHSGLSADAVDMIGSYPQGKGLLGAILQHKDVIRLPNLQDDARSVGFPPHHPPMTSFLGMPLRAGNNIVGNLYLTDKIGAQSFTEADEKLVALFAAHAAIAIQNAHLYSEVTRLAVVEERTRIGMDLHDGIIQSIYAVGLMLESARLILPAGSEESANLINTAIDGLNGSISDLRNFILDLRPRRFTGDLEEGLGRLVREFIANSMVEATQQIDSQVIGQLSSSIARAIFLTTQEALANVARHAKATQVHLTLVQSGKNEITLQIRDNGQGFNRTEAAEQVGHGLANMETRTENLNGTLLIESQKGKGTLIQLSCPIE